MLYTVYKTTNLANGKYYFGVHKTKDPNDSYLGSGNYIRRAVAKYGELSFRKDVLFVYLDPESAFGKEDELIQCYRGLDPLCMNLRKGGNGGFDWINKNGLSGCVVGGKIAGRLLKDFYQQHPEIREQRSKAIIERNRKLASNPQWLEKARLSAARASLLWKGKHHNQQYYDAQSQKQQGVKNNRFGAKWVYHPKLLQCKPVLANEIRALQETGWLLGRVRDWTLVKECPQCHKLFKARKGEQIRCSVRCAERAERLLGRPAVGKRASCLPIGQRPTAETLHTLLSEHSYRTVAKLFGMSHMAIKGWACDLGLKSLRAGKSAPQINGKFVSI